MQRRLLLFVLVATLALVADACGGKTETSGRSTGGSGGSGAGSVAGTGAAPYGGYGGAPFGGYGGGPDGGYGGMGGAPPCYGCKDYTISGLSMKSCCGTTGACGGLVDATLAALIDVPLGCYEVDQLGKPDALCPPMKLDAGLATFPGCCRAQGGTCGYSMDISSVGGPNFGCVDSGPITGIPPLACGGINDPCAICVQWHCQSQLAMCLSNTQCNGIIQCTQACATQVCAQKCVQTYPGGAPAFKDLESCMSAQCPVECQQG